MPSPRGIWASHLSALMSPTWKLPEPHCPEFLFKVSFYRPQWLLPLAIWLNSVSGGWEMGLNVSLLWFPGFLCWPTPFLKYLISIKSHVLERALYVYQDELPSLRKFQGFEGSCQELRTNTNYVYFLLNHSHCFLLRSSYHSWIFSFLILTFILPQNFYV